MTKLVINKGTGFGLSHEAIMRYAELAGISLHPYKYNHEIESYIKIDYKTWDLAREPDYFRCSDDVINRINERDKVNELLFSTHILDRDDPLLVQVVEELGERADNIFSELKVVEIPDNVVWEIDEDEMGPERVREVSRVWD
jgi:hypothetical protein